MFQYQLMYLHSVVPWLPFLNSFQAKFVQCQSSGGDWYSSISISTATHNSDMKLTVHGIIQ